jgi:predicted transcriptional regulator
MPDVIPEDVKRFLLASIDSISQLEALLLLRASPKETHTVESMAERLYISPRDAGTVLAKLLQRGLIRMEDGQRRRFWYDAGNGEVARIVDRLADVYAKYLIPVTNFIHQKSRRSIQDFADAFKLKQDKGHDA